MTFYFKDYQKIYFHKRRIVALPALNPNASIIKPVIRLCHPGGTGMKEEPRRAPKARTIKPVM